MTDPRMTWYMITYAGTHASEQAFWPIFVCDGLADRYINHFRRKGAPINVKEVVTASIDFGGIVRQDAEYLPFDLGGFTLEIMGSHVPDAEAYITTAAIDGFEHPALQGFLRNIAFTEAHAASLREQLKKAMPEALAIADLDNKWFNEQVVGQPHVHASPRRTRGVGST